MSIEGWAIALALMLGAFLPVLGARTPRATRAFAVLGAVSALATGLAALWTAVDPSSGAVFFPSTSGFVFVFVALPLGLGLPATGIALAATKRSRLSGVGRIVLGTFAFCLPPTLYLIAWTA